MGFYCGNDVIERVDMTMAEKMVYICLTRHANKQGQSFPSYRKLAEESRCCKRTVMRAVSKLIEMGLIILQHRYRENGKQTSNLYTIVKHVTHSVTRKAHKVKDSINTYKDRYKSTQNSKKKEMIRELYLS